MGQSRIERMIAFTDKTVYLAGERVWMKLLCFDGAYQELLSLSKVAYVELLDRKNQPVAQLKIAMNNGAGSGVLTPPVELPTGSYELCVYTRWMENFGEYIFFRKEITIINSFRGNDSMEAVSEKRKNVPAVKPFPVRFIMDSSVSGRRQFKKIRLVVPDAVKHKFPAGLSVSVYRVDSLERQDEPAQIFPLINSKDSAVNLFRYPPELSGPIVAGRAHYKADGSPAPGVLLYLSVPGKLPRFYHTESDKEGRFFVELPGYYGDGEIVVQPDPADSSRVRFVVESPFYQHEFRDEKGRAEYYPMSAEQLKDLRLRHIGLQVENGYWKEALVKNVLKEPVDSALFFGTSDEAFELDAYTRFTTMEEVFREYVHTVMVRRGKSGLQLRVRDKSTGEVFDDAPFLLLDGVPVFNATTFFRYDPLKLKAGRVLASRYVLGWVYYRGIVSLQTYTGDLNGYPLEKYLTVREYNGMHESRHFFSPQYDTVEKRRSRMPDFRTVLYWEPALKLDDAGGGEVRFYTGDIPGRYMIKVEGVGVSGSWVWGEGEMEVLE